MKICNTNNCDFLWIANLLLSKKVQHEIGWSICLSPNTQFIYNDYGFVSYRLENEIYFFDYDYIIPEYRRHGEYKRLFKHREIICGGKLCKINTKNSIVKIFLLKNDYQIIKENGSWTYFEKHL